MRTATEHQSLPAANVDLQKVKDVLEQPQSRGRTRKDDDDHDDEDRGTCDGNNCKEHAESSNYERENARQTVDLPRYEHRSTDSVL